MMAFTIGMEEVRRGARKTVELPISVLANHTPINLPVHVINGTEPGPVLFISGVVHGDEILGVEIVRRVTQHPALKRLSGTLLAVPIVNAFGFLNHSRYMPDRRDLNRSFPGSDHGSLASLLADLFMNEVVLRSQYGIDLHTAALHRSNLPQIRIAPDEPELMALAEQFSPPVILVSKLRDGTLRQCARDNGVKMLLYEAGEALRFDETAIDVGVRGILNVMASLNMIVPLRTTKPVPVPAISYSSSWLRAPEGGVLRSAIDIGARVAKDAVIGEISSPLGDLSVAIIAEDDGIVVGRTNLPIVNRGDALFHVARMKRTDMEQAPLDEDEII
ncbi:MAG: succinylglutamate desuccinylase/aspartoacylase family protein [Aestuariivirga sp.]